MQPTQNGPITDLHRLVENIGRARDCSSGGHHVGAKKAFEGAAGYDASAALAIPNAELERLGVSHNAVSGAQMSLYVAFAKTGAPLTWEAMWQIEALALVRGGMAPGMAAATETKAFDALKQSGVPGPIRIPWGQKNAYS
jgi:hypothetical protein